MIEYYQGSAEVKNSYHGRFLCITNPWLANKNLLILGEEVTPRKLGHERLLVVVTRELDLIVQVFRLNLDFGLRGLSLNLRLVF